MPEILTEMEEAIKKVRKSLEEQAKEREKAYEKKIKIFKKVFIFLKETVKTFYSQTTTNPEAQYHWIAEDIKEIFSNSEIIEDSDSLIFFAGCGCGCKGNQWEKELEEIARLNEATIKKILIIHSVKLANDSFKRLSEKFSEQNITFMFLNIYNGFSQ